MCIAYVKKIFTYYCRQFSKSTMKSNTLLNDFYNQSIGITGTYYNFSR